MTKHTTVESFLEDESIDPKLKGIGGSDVGTILGANPHKSSWELWAELHGNKPRFRGNMATKVGHEQEPYICDTYARKHKASLVGPLAPMVDGWYRRNPDRLWLAENRVIEAKSSLGYGASKIWGPEADGIASVPEYVNMQVRWYMAKPFDLFAMAKQNEAGKGLDSVSLEQAGIAMGQLWQAEATDIAVFMTGPDHRYYRVYHDKSISDDMLTKVDDWWTKHVIKGIEPDPDGTDAYDKELRKRLKQSTQLIKKSNEDIDKSIHIYHSTGAIISKLEKLNKKAKQEIMEYIDEDKGLESTLGTITFNTEHRSSLNKEMLFNNMLKHLPREIVTGILEKSKKPAEIRRLRKKMLAAPDTSTDTITNYLK